MKNMFLFWEDRYVKWESEKCHNSTENIYRYTRKWKVSHAYLLPSATLLVHLFHQKAIIVFITIFLNWASTKFVEKWEKVCISIICVGTRGIQTHTSSRSSRHFSPLTSLSLQPNENGNFYFFVSGWKWRRLSAAFVFSDEVLVLQEDYDFWCRKSESGLYLFLVVKWGK